MATLMKLKQNNGVVMSRPCEGMTREPRHPYIQNVSITAWERSPLYASAVLQRPSPRHSASTSGGCEADVPGNWVRSSPDRFLERNLRKILPQDHQGSPSKSAFAAQGLAVQGAVLPLRCHRWMNCRIQHRQGTSPRPAGGEGPPTLKKKTFIVQSFCTQGTLKPMPRG